MRAIHNLRRQLLKKVNENIGLPPELRLFTGQATKDPNELIRLGSQPTTPIQNADGTFRFTIGYDSLSDIADGIVTL